MDPIKVYNLGDRGVNVDQSPIHTTDGDLSKAQNAIRNPMGLLGGLQKRPGLVKFTTSVAAGSILGGIGVPLVLEATSIGGVSLPGAGVSTSTLTGSEPGEGGSDGTGTGTGAGSGAGGGGSVSGGGSGSGGGGGGTGTGGRKVFWARSTSGVSFGATRGWYTFLNPPQTGVMPAAGVIEIGNVPTGTDPVDPKAGGAISIIDNPPFGLLQGCPSRAAVFENKLYYPGSDYTVGTTEPFIRTFDGVTDAPFSFTPSTGQQDDGGGLENVYGRKITAMLANEGKLYVAVADGTTDQNVVGARVLMFDIASKAGSTLGSSPSATGNKPWPLVKNSDPSVFGQRFVSSLCWHEGRLWAGDASGSSAHFGQIWSIRPGVDTEWTLDRTMSQGAGVGFLVTYEGQLYAGTFNSSNQYIEKRDTLGSWTVDLTVSSGANGHFLCAAVFLNTPTTKNLYAALWITGTSAAVRQLFIYQRTIGGTWSIVYTGTVATLAAPTAMFVQNVVDSVLYVGGGNYGGTVTTLDGFLLTSPDGTTWSNQTSALTSLSGMGLNACYGELVV